MRRRTTWRHTLLALIGMLALLATACQPQPTATEAGSSPAAAEGEATEEAAAESPEGEEPAETVAVTAGLPVGFIYAPLRLANHLGYFEEEGLAVEEIVFESGGDMTAALVGGSVDLVTTGLERPARLYEEGQRIKSTVGIMTAPVFAILGQPDLDAPVGDLEGTVQSLRGLQVGIPGFGGAAHATMLTVLERAGMSESDITMVEIGLGATAIAAMEQGAVQALITIEPDIAELEAMGYQVLLDLRDPDQSGEMASLPAAGMLATEDWLQENEDVGRRFVHAIVRAHEFLNSDDPEVMEVLAELYPELEPDILESVYENSLPGFDPHITEEGLALWQEALVTGGILQEVIPYEELVATQYVDDWD